MKRHKEIQEKNKIIYGAEYKDYGFVCCEPDGSIIDPSNFSKRFNRILIENGFSVIRFHDLRHSFATNMIRLGVPINTVSRMLGHSSVSITLDVYAHVMDEMQEEAIERLDADISKYIELQEEVIDVTKDNNLDTTPDIN